MEERIAKRMARAGVCSRREAERMIEQRRVVVNGEILTTPAFTVKPDDIIKVDGEILKAVDDTRLWLFHKPSGVITSHNDPQGRKSVFEILPQNLPRVISIGRLDMNTEGLLLLTNDGALARHLELPSTGWIRRYRVRVYGRVDKRKLAELAEGVVVDRVAYGSIEATLDSQQGSNSWLTISIREGKNREIRKVMEHIGLQVNRLMRVSYGPFQLGAIPLGEVKEVPGKVLREQIGNWEKL